MNPVREAKRFDPKVFLSQVGIGRTLVEVIKKKHIFSQGDPGDAVFVILDGEIEVRTSSPGGRDLRLVALRRGEIAGEMAALDGGLRSADMVAARRTRLWRIPRAALIEALESEPKAAVALLAEMSARLRRTNAALEARATLDLGGRLAQLLIGEQNPRALISKFSWRPSWVGVNVLSWGRGTRRNR